MRDIDAEDELTLTLGRWAWLAIAAGLAFWCTLLYGLANLVDLLVWMYRGAL